VPLRIEDYALIGDCETAALVGRDGSIDWLCWPRFDSGACFSALLGTPEHGRWLIAPHGDPAEARVTRRYRPGTLILETEFETAEGAVTLTDFMPLRGQASDLVRIVAGRRGRVRMRTELVLRFGYGSIVPWVTRLDDRTLRAVGGPDMVVLHTPTPLHGEGLHTVGDFEVAAGQSLPFYLTYAPSHHPVPDPIDPEAALRDTERFWREWSDRCRDTGEWSEAVRRSLVTLKALTYRPTGGIVAAPTTSLPELIGGPRNWDYRFCWVRDATLTLMALMNAGYYDEAGAWRDWLLRAVAGSPEQMQIMYGIAGERRLSEWEVPWLPGYENSRPVRIGNAAHAQHQLDIYGEVMDALHQARRGGLVASEPGWAVQRGLLGRVGAVWQEPDEGIWEVRGERRHFTHSKVMAWVALDRAVRSVERLGLDGPLEPGAGSAGRSTATSVGAASTPGSTRSCSPTDRSSSMRACCSAGSGFLAAWGPAHPWHGRGDRAPADRRRPGPALRQLGGRRRPAARRGRLPRLQLLARRRLRDARADGRRPPAVRAAALAPQRRRPAGRGVRYREQAPGRQLSSGLLAPGARQHRPQPDPDGEARRAALRARRHGSCLSGCGWLTSSRPGR
jgi:GH15 family glucan-1,4-alpha-glucosidase